MNDSPRTISSESVHKNRECQAAPAGTRPPQAGRLAPFAKLDKHGQTSLPMPPAAPPPSRRRTPRLRLGLGSGQRIAKRSYAYPFVVIAAVALGPAFGGCGPDYRQLRREGQKAMLDHAYGSARIFFRQADDLRPRRVANLHDLGACSLMLARARFDQRNHAAAMRELDAAVSYYSGALDVYPGHRASIEGKNIALELKGQFDEALEHAEWAAEFVGPAASQYIYLAQELEERNDRDGAFLRYRQAVAMEPRNAEAHVALARFLLRNKNEEAAVDHLQAAYLLNPLDEWVIDELTKRGAVPPLGSPKAGTP